MRYGKDEQRILENYDDRRHQVRVQVDQYGNVPWFLEFQGRYYHLHTDGIFHEIRFAHIPKESEIVAATSSSKRSPKRKGRT